MSFANLTRRSARSLCILVGIFSALVAALLLRPSEVGATPPASAQAAPPVAEALDAGVPPTMPTSDPTHATIVFATSPPATAMVTWGRKRLGKITPGKPLVVVRPRDSGPLDVMVRATDFLAVQTRAHTFSDHRVIVKLTPLDMKSELLGYRAPLDDAGVASAEQSAALDAIGASDASVSPATPTFQVVPAAAPVPQGPWLVP